jgi:hypothetical protein
MTVAQLKERELEIKRIHDRSIESLHQRFIEENAKFKVGDFVRNVTGIIKIESIRYDQYSDEGITYCGFKYRWLDSTSLSPVNKPQSCMSEPLQKIESPIVEE